jgi:hypothetical protein
MLKNECGITKKVITTHNPQANSMVERAHQVMHKLIRTMGIKGKSDLEQLNFGWDGVLSAVRQAVRSTVHTTQHTAPTQLVFDCDVILNVAFEADRQYIKERKLHHIVQNKQEGECHTHPSPMRSRRPRYGKTGPITKTWFRPLLGAIHGLSNQ